MPRDIEELDETAHRLRVTWRKANNFYTSFVSQFFDIKKEFADLPFGPEWTFQRWLLRKGGMFEDQILTQLRSHMKTAAEEDCKRVEEENQRIAAEKRTAAMRQAAEKRAAVSERRAASQHRKREQQAIKDAARAEKEAARLEAEAAKIEAAEVKKREIKSAKAKKRYAEKKRAKAAEIKDNAVTTVAAPTNPKLVEHLANCERIDATSRADSERIQATSRVDLGREYAAM